jgi:hypothetical protein
LPTKPIRENDKFLEMISGIYSYYWCWMLFIKGEFSPQLTWTQLSTVNCSSRIA